MSWSFFLHCQAFGDKKAVSRYAQRRMVMKAAPAAPLEMPQAEFLLELLVIALDSPTQFGEAHELLGRCVSRHRTQEVLARLDFSFGPLDEQPLLLCGPGWLRFARGAMYPYCGKTRRQCAISPFAPCDRAKASRWQLHGQLFRLQRRLAVRLQADGAGHPDHVGKTHRRELLAKPPFP